jgi:hypothetical protein
MEAMRTAKLKIGVDPLGGAGVAYRVVEAGSAARPAPQASGSKIRFPRSVG